MRKVKKVSLDDLKMQECSNSQGFIRMVWNHDPKFSKSCFYRELNQLNSLILVIKVWRLNS